MWTRRKLLSASTVACLAAAVRATEVAPAGAQVLDAHVHVWDLKRFRLPWLSNDDRILYRDFLVRDYLEAIRGTGVSRAVYVEIGLDAAQQRREVEVASELCRPRDSVFAAAVVGGDPAASGFNEYVRDLKGPHVRGIRHAYEHGQLDNPAFLRGLRLLGQSHLNFDLLVSPELLEEAATLAAKAPDTQFILDHCGNIDPFVFRKDPDRGDVWRRGIEALAKQFNVACKISGVMEAASAKATADDAAPIVNHCLDSFGPDRVLFASNWPVCLKGTPLAGWLRTVRQIVSHRSRPEQRKLFYDNAATFYQLDR